MEEGTEEAFWGRGEGSMCRAGGEWVGGTTFGRGGMGFWLRNKGSCYAFSYERIGGGKKEKIWVMMLVKRLVFISTF